MATVSDSVENELYSAKDSQLVEDAKHIFLHGMFAEAKFASHRPVAESVGDKGNYLLLARGEQVEAIRIHRLQRRNLRNDGVTGLLFHPGSAPDLADKIALLDQKPELTAQMGVAGRALIQEHYSSEKHLNALSGLYERLVAKPRPATLENISREEGVRVAFIGGRGLISKYSGIETYYEEVGKRLIKSGHDVTVYCRSYFTPQLAEHNGMRLVRLPTIRSKHFDTFTHTLLSTIHAIFSRCDVVHYHALGSAMFSFLPRLFGKKIVVTVQGLDWKRKKWGKVASSILHFAEGRAATFPNATIVVSRILQQHYRTQGSRGTIYIPNGTSLRATKTSRRIHSWGLETNKYILFLGRFSPEKNCHLLIEAYKQLENTHVKLVLAGGSSYSDAYADTIRAEQNNYIRVLDWLSGEALDELISNAMLFVLPSDIEGLSLSLLDAMSAGVCVLTSDIPENLEVTDGVGYSFQRGNVNDLTRMLSLLISNPELRRAAVEGALQRVEQQYLWDSITTRIEQVYRALLLDRKAASLSFLSKITSAKPAA